MNVLIFGATGMVGQGVLRECLRDPDVGRVLAVGRRPTGQAHEKLRDLVVPDPADLRAVEPQLAGFDACFFCLGVTSAGLSEERYTRLTFDLTLAVARTLARLDPGMTFVYVSGSGTDSSERGRVMWARVKGRTENALLALPFKAAYMFRPAYIQPLDGIRSRTRWYRVALRGDGAALPHPQAAVSRRRDDHGAARPGDARGGSPRLRPARAGDSRHQRLVSAGRNAARGSPRPGPASDVDFGPARSTTLWRAPCPPGTLPEPPKGATHERRTGAGRDAEGRIRPDGGREA